jgi:hypothetical protein
MRMVAPRTGAVEISIAEEQLEYKPLVAAMYQNPAYGGALTLLTRWRLTEEEKARVAAGEDLYLSVMTFGQPLQPLNLQVGPEGYMVDLPSQNEAEEPYSGP